ncbi:DUF1207 domain-containing protein [Acidihalobacter ferrooxydans]|uniref:DUF1207 domain-containing protein n=1 Tax=Acidihalobacter ferrooxydans TaxID=1765967 RepID=UPI0018DC45EE|nr:DUF1207 domain-containing protein [Acidihalobacter ferrooxydans]
MLYKLGWSAGSYTLKLEHGMASVMPPKNWTGSSEKLSTILTHVPGISSVKILLPHAPKALSVVTEQPQDTSPQSANDGQFFPRGLLFRPLLADPKQPNFFVSDRVYHMPIGTFNIGAVGFGGTLGLYRWNQGPFGGQLQIDFQAGEFSQFDLVQPAPILVNSDFTVGIPLTWRRGANSLRIDFMHQSSHLGAVYYAQVHPTHFTLSFEKLSAIWSHQWPRWRLYGGGGFLLWPAPKSLKRPYVHTGLEYRGPRILSGWARFVAGLDIKNWSQDGWQPNTSLKFGLAYAGPDPAGRHLRILVELYDGQTPNGHFVYEYRMRYIGIGTYLDF